MTSGAADVDPGLELARVRDEDGLRRRVAQLETLTIALERIGAARDLESALEGLLRAGVALLGAEHGLARVINPATGDRLVEMVLFRDGSLGVARHLGPLVPGSYGERLLAGEPASIVDDYETADHARYPLRDLILRDGMRSAVHVPLACAGRRIGNLSLDHSRPGFFGPPELKMAAALASRAGAAIERARLETERAAGEAAERERARLDGALLVARTVAHELNNALSPVTGFAELLAADPRVASDPRLAAFARLIGDAAQDAASKIARLQRITRLEEAAMPSGSDMRVLDVEKSAAPRGEADTAAARTQAR